MSLFSYLFISVCLTHSSRLSAIFKFCTFVIREFVRFRIEYEDINKINVTPQKNRIVRNKKKITPNLANLIYHTFLFRQNHIEICKDDLDQQ